ncbi:MAG: M4 family metallopeptidase [Alphaproteobacteria bacterium]|nr:M4 family metallopeptidase [Alphaproteobacteria bacterium]MCB9797478.1 M4 family metallopeptidase [Alphaproteobacteria bacterium]
MPRSLLALLALTACGQPSDLDRVGPDVLPGGVGSLVDESLRALGPEATAMGVFEDDLVAMKLQVDHLGQSHARVQQTYEGLAVFGGEAIVHLAADGALRGVTNKLVPEVEVDTSPVYSAEEMLERALTLEGIAPGEQDRSPSVELMVFPGAERDHLVWRVALSRIEGGGRETMPVLFLDAHTGELIERYDDLQTATQRGSGVTNYYGDRSFTFYSADNSTWVMEDSSRDLGAFTANQSNSMSDVVACSDSDTTFDDASQYECSDAFYGLKRAWRFYNDELGWWGMDGNGGPTKMASATGSGQVITAVVNWNSGWVNATFNGDHVRFGDGNGTSYSPLTTLDVIGHEWTHGVVKHTAGLVYSSESGALNESYADIMGNMIERDARGESSGNWLVAEEARLNGLAMRSFSDPTSLGNGRDHYDDRYTGTNDNGGVHSNSGIQNLAFYLVSQGGDHPTYGGRAVEGVGADAATAIAWRALSTYLTSTSTFADARDAWVDAAVDLYGERSEEWAAARDAWALVGVGDSACEGAVYDVQESGSVSGSGSWYPGGEAGFTPSSFSNARVYVPGGSFTLSLEIDVPASGWGNPGGWTTLATGVDQGAYLEVVNAYGGFGQTLRWRVDYSGASGLAYACYDE